MTSMVTDIIYNERGVLSGSDSNSIVVFKCDGCSEICKHLTCLASSPSKKYLCDDCLKKY
jgi:hypothetical protein